jgi:DNA repair protein RecN (Recombination protein N)
MIQYLQIRDLALLDEVTLEFEVGFTAITGETGAGKSILLGALSMLSGNRLDRSIIRHGSERCQVEATISIKDPSRLNEKLRELDLPECEEGALILHRSLHQTRLPRIQINGSSTTLSNLSEIGEYWIDFHGPGEPQKLFKERFQLEILDLYSGVAKEMELYQEQYRSWKRLRTELDALSDATELSDDEIHYLQEQIRRIDELGVDEESLHQLEHQFQRLSHTEEILANLQSIHSGLYEESGVSEKLASVMNAARTVEGLDPASAPVWRRVESLSIELEDLASDIQSLTDDVQLDEDAVSKLRSRMELWMDLKRKHGKSTDAILLARKNMQDRLETHADLAGSRFNLQSKIDDTLKELVRQGSIIQKHREQSALKLAGEVLVNLGHLGFSKAQFSIQVLTEDSPREYGTSRCQFLFSPNPGQPLMPLNKIASSGETARVMLGLKNVLAAFDATPVLVFDEVDANVGGEIGRAVGMEMAALGTRHQVFCVTHLPQVAALANSHYVVRKSQTDDSTTVTIEPLAPDSDDRMLEIARMLGDRHSASALAHARELLKTNSL